MPREFQRTDRVSEALQMELSLLLHQKTHDPRLQDIHLVKVDVSRDFSHAKVYYTFLEPSDERIAGSQKALKKAAGFFRTELSKILKMRSVPMLHFVFDDTNQKARALSKKIDEVLRDDDQRTPAE